VTTLDRAVYPSKQPGTPSILKLPAMLTSSVRSALLIQAFA